MMNLLILFLKLQEHNKAMNETGSVTEVKEHLLQYSSFVEGNFCHGIKKKQV